jgi:hypothetical protein
MFVVSLMFHVLVELILGIGLPAETDEIGEVSALLGANIAKVLGN